MLYCNTTKSVCWQDICKTLSTDIEIKHLVLAGLDTAAEGGGAGGIGSGALGPTSTGTLTGAGSDSAELLLMGFSGAV